MRIYDCFLFFRELDLLELRLHTHAPWAHAFIAVESTRTFSNIPKPVVLDPKAKRFAPFKDRLRHIVADKLPWPEAKGRNLGKAERMRLNGEQWERVRVGLHDVKPDDVLILSDLDEMMRPEAVQEAVAIAARDGLARFGITLYFYHLNGFRGRNWHGPIAVRAGDIMKPHCSLWTLKQGTRNNPAVPSVQDAGWHFSYLGGAAAVEQKLRSAAHPEYDRFLDDRKGLERWIADGHPFAPNNDSAGGVKAVPIDATFPPYLVANKDKFKHLIRPVK